MSAAISRREKTLDVLCDSDIDRAEGERLCLELMRFLDTDTDFERIQINLQNRFTISDAAVRALAQVARHAKRSGRGTFCLACPPGFKKILTQMGMDLLLIPLEVEMPKAAKKRSLLDAGFVNPFIEGTLEVLKVQCSFACTPKRLALKAQFTPLERTEIAGVLSLSSATFKGSIAICFSKKVFLALMSRMLGETFTEMSPEIEDGGAEITNMIFGHAKKILNERGYSLERALPTVIKGQDLSVRHVPTAETVVLPFDSEDGEFFMEITIDQEDARAAA